jgi:hypothetical protein
MKRGKVKVAKYRVRADSWTVLRNILSEDVPFTGSNMSGVPGKLADTGQLPAHWANQYNASDVLYTVCSYDTPIAWKTPGGWVVPETRYSGTMSTHQGKVNTAVYALEASASYR